jgi:hypothetical protein
MIEVVRWYLSGFYKKPKVRARACGAHNECQVQSEP